MPALVRNSVRYLLVFVFASLIANDVTVYIASKIEGREYAPFTVLWNGASRVDESFMYLANVNKGGSFGPNENGYVNGARSVQDASILPNYVLTVTTILQRMTGSDIPFIGMRAAFILIIMALYIRLLTRIGLGSLSSVAVFCIAAYEVFLSPLAYLNAFHILRSAPSFNPEINLVGFWLQSIGVNIAAFQLFDFSWFPLPYNARPVISRINSPLLCLPFLLLFAHRLLSALSHSGSDELLRGRKLSHLALAISVVGIALSYPPYLLVIIPWLLVILAISQSARRSFEIQMATAAGGVSVAATTLFIHSFSKFHQVAIGSLDQGPWTWRGWLILSTSLLTMMIWRRRRDKDFDGSASTYTLTLGLSLLPLMLLAGPLAQAGLLQQVWILPQRVWIYVIPLLLAGVVAKNPTITFLFRRSSVVFSIAIAAVVVMGSEIFVGLHYRSLLDVTSERAIIDSKLINNHATVAFTSEKSLGYVVSTTSNHPLTTYAISADVPPQQIVEKMAINYRLTGRPLPASPDQVDQWLIQPAFSEPDSLNVVHWIYHHGDGGLGRRKFNNAQVWDVVRSILDKPLCDELRRFQVSYVMGPVSIPVLESLRPCVEPLAGDLLRVRATAS